MLCADQYISTYSEKGSGRGNGVTIPEILDIVKSWIVDARRIVVTEREKIERMKQIPVSYTHLVGLYSLFRCHDPTAFERAINPALRGSYRGIPRHRKIVRRSPCGSRIAIF